MSFGVNWVTSMAEKSSQPVPRDIAFKDGLSPEPYRLLVGPLFNL